MTTTAQSVTRNTSSAVGSEVSSDPPGFQPLSASQLSTLSAGGAVIDWPAGHYVYVERVGPFPSVAPAAWAVLHAALPAVAAANAVTAYVALYRTDTQTYRACVMTEQEPRALPAGLTHEQRAGGRYARFVLDGSYAALPASLRPGGGAGGVAAHLAQGGRVLHRALRQRPESHTGGRAADSHPRAHSMTATAAGKSGRSACFAQLPEVGGTSCVIAVAEFLMVQAERILQRQWRGM